MTTSSMCEPFRFAPPRRRNHSSVSIASVLGMASTLLLLCTVTAILLPAQTFRALPKPQASQIAISQDASPRRNVTAVYSGDVSLAPDPSPVSSPLVQGSPCVFSAQSAKNVTIGPQFFGQGYINSTSQPLLVGYGTARIYVGPNVPEGLVWSVLNPQNPLTYDPAHAPTDPNNAAYNWNALDTRLAQMKSAGVGCVLYTFQDTPDWDTTQVLPPGVTCDYLQHYSCLPPADLSPTGGTAGGAHSTAFNFLAAMESHIHDPTSLYLNTHADIGIVEVVNEINSSPVLNPGASAWSGAYWDGNFDQLRRVVEDARCAWTGQGSVHVNGFDADPIPCDWTPMGNQSPPTIIGSPSVVSDLPSSRSVLCNFLYGNLGVTQNGSGICGGPPKAGSNPSGDMAANSNHGADMVDAVLFHPYPLSGYSEPERVYAENLPDIIAFLQPNERLKPFLASEWGGRTAVYSSDGQVALVPREILALFAQGTSLSVTWEYDKVQIGDEFTPYDGLQCQQQPGCLNAVGVAHNTVYQWLVGNTLVGCTAPAPKSSSIIRCDLTGPNGYQAEIAWDCAVHTDTVSPSGNSTMQECMAADYTAKLNCAGQNWSNNSQCGSTPYTLPFPPSQWRDLAGNVYPFQQNQAMLVGAKPVLVERWYNPPPPPVTLTPIADTYVNSVNPNNNYGSNTPLKAGGAGVSQISYLKFDLTALAGRSITSAKLRLWVYNGALGIYSANSVSDTSWTESGTTYVNAPSVGSDLADVTNPVSGTWLEFDVTATVTANLGNLISFAITSSSSRTLLVDSREVTYQKPQLVIQ